MLFFKKESKPAFSIDICYINIIYQITVLSCQFQAEIVGAEFTFCCVNDQQSYFIPGGEMVAMY